MDYWKKIVTCGYADRLRRSLKRLGYDLKPAERRGRFAITPEGSKVEEAGGLDLAGVEQWIREREGQEAGCAGYAHHLTH